MSTTSLILPTPSLGTAIFSSIIPSHTTSSSPLPSNSTIADPPGSDPLDPNDDDPNTKQNTVLYYYFFIFVVFVVAVIIISWLAYHRRRRIRKALNRNNGQSALQRDLEGWSPGDQRLFPLGTRALTRGSTQQDEGFNEYGEAPPAYKPKDESKSRPGSDGSASSLATPAVPLTAQSHGGPAKLPQYDEIVKELAVEPETIVEEPHISALRQEPTASSADSPQPSQPSQIHNS